MRHHARNWCVLTLCTPVPSAFPMWTCWQLRDIPTKCKVTELECVLYTFAVEFSVHMWYLRFSQWCCLRCEMLSLGRRCRCFGGHYRLHLQGQTAQEDKTFLDCLTQRWRHCGPSKFPITADWITQHHISGEWNLLYTHRLMLNDFTREDIMQAASCSETAVQYLHWRISQDWYLHEPCCENFTPDRRTS
jgi:hypothetical protein